MPTQTHYRTAKPKNKPYQLLDGNGLDLEIKPNGVTAWRYRFELPDGVVYSRRAPTHPGWRKTGAGTGGRSSRLACTAGAHRPVSSGRR